MNLAHEGPRDEAPHVAKERETACDRTLKAEEYEAFLQTSRRWLQRLLIAANETALDQGTLLRLSWDAVQGDLITIKAGFVRKPARASAWASHPRCARC